MAFEDTDLDNVEEPGGSSSSGGGNRTFLIAAGVLGAIAILTLVCIAIYTLVWRPQQAQQQAMQVATVNAQNTAVALAITQTSAAAAATFTPTVTPTQVPDTATPTPTFVLAQATSTAPSQATLDARTATVAALLTQAAQPQGTQTAQAGGPTATALPSTGFADEVGLPAMLGLAFLLVGIIFVARRLRTA